MNEWYKWFGPYQLNPLSISELVGTLRCGVYVLTRDDGIYRYVGRSDTDVFRRLFSWVGKDYTAFTFCLTPTAQQAYEMECQLYHQWKLQLDNENHPDRPFRGAWCPICENNPIFRALVLGQ